jgi:hypothetical protein
MLPIKETRADMILIIFSFDHYSSDSINQKPICGTEEECYYLQKKFRRKQKQGHEKLGGMSLLH